jgi:hypothetical protein
MTAESLTRLYRDLLAGDQDEASRRAFVNSLIGAESGNKEREYEILE